MKRPPIEWEKISANDISDKGLITKIYKELIELNIKKIQLKWVKDSNKNPPPQKRHTGGQQTWKDGKHH